MDDAIGQVELTLSPAQTRVPPGPGGAQLPAPTTFLSVLCLRASAKHELVLGRG